MISESPTCKEGVGENIKFDEIFQLGSSGKNFLISSPMKNDLKIKIVN